MKKYKIILIVGLFLSPYIAFAQNYYYYNGKKVNLEISKQKIFVSQLVDSLKDKQIENYKTQSLSVASTLRTLKALCIKKLKI